MKISEVKESLFKNKNDLKKTAVELDLDIEDLKEIVKEYNLIPEISLKASFKKEVLDNIDNYINEKYKLAMIIKSELLRQIKDKKISVTDPSFMSSMKYVDELIKDCFDKSEKYKITSKKAVV